MDRFEEKRLEALRSLNLLDSPAEPRFDKVTETAKSLFGTKVALFSLVEDHRQWFKSTQGLGVKQTPRSVAFCDSAIKQSNIFIVNDAHTDEAFKDNALVTGPPHIRFYAGAPIREPRGFAIGTLCIIDDQPKNYTQADLQCLRLLADIIEHILVDVARDQANNPPPLTHKLDRAIQRAQTVFITSHDSELAFDYVLQDLLDLTKSSYGLIGEVHRDEDAQRYLQIKSITNLSWNKESEALYQRLKNEGMFFRNQDNILGLPLKTGETIIANDIEQDPRAMGRPGGHPRLINYIGIPIFIGERLIAMVGLANKTGDFQKELVEELSPLLSTIGNLVERNQLIKDNEQQRKLLEDVAHFDELTGLPNRRRLRELYETSKNRSLEMNQSLAVCFVDIDGFKEINDQFGHSTGDKVLRELSSRLLFELRDDDIVARLGGDEFVVVLNNFVDTSILERLLRILQEPFSDININARVSASIGYTVFPDNNEDLDTLLRHADQAMYAAKADGKNRFRRFDVELHSENAERLAHLSEIVRAVDNQEFELFYQPQLDLTAKKVIGFEALIRWRHPERGILGPAEFLDIIEYTEHARTLSLFVINHAVEQLLTWHEQNQPFCLSVNISSSHFLNGRFKSDIQELTSRLPTSIKHLFKMELLETITSDNIGYIENTLNYCRDLGLTVSLDDFGTGYSSLEYFRRLKVQEIKIDRSFVSALSNGEEDIQLVSAIIGLSNSFKREIVAEGVETKAISDMLLQMGCSIHQGFFYCKPLPAKDAINWALEYSNQPLISA